MSHCFVEDCDENKLLDIGSAKIKMLKRKTHNKTRQNVYIFIGIVLFFVSVYIYLNYLQQTYNSAKQTNKRCTSELTYLQHQLKVVTDYKTHLENLLQKSKKEEIHQKEQFQEMMESCVAMKQQSTICEHQFQDLKNECKKVKQDYEKALEELGTLKLTE